MNARDPVNAVIHSAFNVLMILIRWDMSGMGRLSLTTKPRRKSITKHTRPVTEVLSLFIDEVTFYSILVDSS